MLIRRSILIFIQFTFTFAKRGGSYGRSGASYPPSQGLSGSNTFSSQHLPKSNAPSYPPSQGLSGSNTYHATGNTYRSNGPTYQKTEVHHHYNYAPPQYISYGSSHHPVYHGTPPVYVYEYRNSGSRFDNLLTGLALYNLGRMSADHRYQNRDYTGYSGELCKLAISKNNGEYEETRIDCRVMSSFIWDAERETTGTVTKTVNVSQSVVHDGNSTVTVQNTTIVNALEVKGPSIQVNPGMSCFMIRVSRDYSILKKKVECALLQEYAQRSLRSNGCVKSVSFVIVLMLSSVLYFR